MKKVIVILLLIASSVNLSAQRDKKNEKFTGTWYLEYQKENESDMSFEKKDRKDYRWGNYITILANGDLYVGYSAPCGNDTNIFRNSGKWFYNRETKEFTTTISVHKKGKRFKVRFDSKNKMAFE